MERNEETPQLLTRAKAPCRGPSRCGHEVPVRITSCLLISIHTLISVDTSHSEIEARAWPLHSKLKWPDTRVCSFGVPGHCVTPVFCRQSETGHGLVLMRPKCLCLTKCLFVVAADLARGAVFEQPTSAVFLGRVRDDGSTGEFDGQYEHSAPLLEAFKGVFGLKVFRQNQRQAINAALLKKDCFILMPTGLSYLCFCFFVRGVFTCFFTHIFALKLNKRYWVCLAHGFWTLEPKKRTQMLGCVSV